MRIDRQTGLISVALLLVSAGITHTGGLYSERAFAAVMVAFALALTACLMSPRVVTMSRLAGRGLIGAALFGSLAWNWFGEGYSDPALGHTQLGIALTLIASLGFTRTRTIADTMPLLAVTAILLSGRAITSTFLLWQDPEHWAVKVLPWLALTGHLTIGLLLARPVKRVGNRDAWAILILLILTGGLTRAVVPLASPNPIVDVHVWIEEATRYVLDGQNPYEEPYPNPYVTERAQQYEFDQPNTEQIRPPAYPLLPVWFGVPCRAGGFDIRYANVCCDILAASFLFLLGTATGQRLRGLLLAGIYLHLPATPFMHEQAWYEPMLAACFGGGVLLAQRGKLLGHVLLGLALTGKQFGAYLLLPLWRGCRAYPVRFVGGLLIGAAICLLPGLLWNAEAFLEVVVWGHLNRDVHPQALSLPTATMEVFGQTLPKQGFWLGGLGLIALLAWRAPSRPGSIGLWVGTALLVFCVMNVAAFFNYYYLVLYLWLLGIAGTDSSRKGHHPT